MAGLPMIEHGGSRTRRWLREQRVRVALWIALAEGVLILVGVIPKTAALLVALVVLALYFVWARERTSGTTHQAFWILAVSQAVIALVPLVLFVLGTLAIILVALIALAALVVLFADRR